MPTKKELTQLGKAYLYLGILGLVVFCMINPLSRTVDNSLVEIAKVSVQSIGISQNIKQVGMIFLLLYTIFVVIESLVLIRDCVRRVYNKNKGNTTE